MQVKTHHVAAGVLLLAAAGLAYLATTTAGNVQLGKYVELKRGPLQNQVLSVDELNMSRNFERPAYPMKYPGQVAAGISQLIAQGFAPLWQPPDPQVAGLPAEREAAW